MKIKLIFISLLLFCIGFSSCKSYKESRKAKKAEKELVKQDEMSDKEYEKLKEAHHKRQATETKNMMAETKRVNEYYNQSRRKKLSLWERIFGPKKHKKPKTKKKKKG